MVIIMLLLLLIMLLMMIQIKISIIKFVSLNTVTFKETILRLMRKKRK